TLERAFEIRLELRPVLNQLGELRKSLERLREAETLGAQLNDDRRRGQVLSAMSNSHSLLGEMAEAVAAGTRAVEIARRLGDLKLRIRATSNLVQAYYYRGDHEQSVELAIENLQALPDEWIYELMGGAAPESVYERSWLIMSLADLGKFNEAVG